MGCVFFFVFFFLGGEGAVFEMNECRFRKLFPGPHHVDLLFPSRLVKIVFGQLVWI